MTDEPKYRDAEWLREQYINERRSTHNIAAECGCSASTVRYWMGKYEIQTREPGPYTADRRLERREWVEKQYVENEKTCEEISKMCDCTPTAVYKWLEKHEIPTKRPVSDGRLRDFEWLNQQYSNEGKTGTEISEKCGCSGAAVYAWLEKHGIETEYDYEYPSGENHPSWKGGAAPYGAGWNKSKRRAVRERDGYTCQDPRCSVTQAKHREAHGEKLHVHHLRKARHIEDAATRNAKENLITLCRDCHQRWEKMADAGLVPELVDGTVEQDGDAA
jgi:transposase